MMITFYDYFTFPGLLQNRNSSGKTQRNFPRDKQPLAFPLRKSSGARFFGGMADSFVSLSAGETGNSLEPRVCM